MILSDALLAQFRTCSDGYELAISLGLKPNDESSLIIDTLLKNGNIDYANWVRKLEVNPNAIKFSGEYKALNFLVYNPKEHIYLSYATLELAQTAQQLLKSNFAEDATVNIEDIIIQQHLIANNNAEYIFQLD